MFTDVNESLKEFQRKLLNACEEIRSAKFFIDYIEAADKVINILTQEEKNIVAYKEALNGNSIPSEVMEYENTIKLKAAEIVNKICVEALSKTRYSPSMRLLAEKVSLTGSYGQDLSSFFYYKAIDAARKEIYSQLKTATSIAQYTGNYQLAKEIALNGAMEVVELEGQILNEEKKILELIRKNPLTDSDDKAIDSMTKKLGIEIDYRVAHYIKLPNKECKIIRTLETAKSLDRITLSAKNDESEASDPPETSQPMDNIELKSFEYLKIFLNQIGKYQELRNTRGSLVS